MLYDLWRWFRGLLATVLWAFVMAGLLGMAEGLSQWLRFDMMAGGGPGFVRAVAPTVALYGGFAMALAALFYTPFYFLMRKHDHPRRRAYALSVGTALGSIVFFYAGYLGHAHVAPDWWDGASMKVTGPIQFVFLVLTAVVLAKPLFNQASRQLLNPRRNMFLAVAFVVVFTSLWPNWREEGRRERVDETIARAEPAAGAPDVVLITIDTWRRDALSALNPQGPPTPALDAVADGGVIYGNFWSSSSWTVPAMASLMTGLPPRALNVDKGRGIADELTTLAETAWRHGYHTAAFASNPYLLPYSGMDQGFDEFEHALELEPLRPAERSILARELDRFAERRLGLDAASIIVAKSIFWLERRSADRPFFLWLHLMDPHVPYLWRDLPDDAPPPVPGRGVPADRGLVPEHAVFRDGVFPAGSLHAVRNDIAGVTPEARRGMRTLYDREVQYADACLGGLFDALRERGLWDNLLLMVTADHGEEFFEHGGFEHGHSLLPEVTGLPLVVSLPHGGAAGTRCDTDHDLLDVMPSLCRTLGWQAPEGIEGRDDLLPVQDVDWPPIAATSAAEPAVMEQMLYGDEQLAVRAWPNLAVGHVNPGELDWFDLLVDPGAARPLVTAPADADAILDSAARLQALWDVMAAETEDDAAEGPSEDVRRKLQSLGY